MALQSQNLVMVGLGIRGDSPPNNIQPPLEDGIHLRWAFRKDLGFPWYGFYLFRRPHRKGQLICLSQGLGRLKPGNLSSNSLSTPSGVITSDRDLLLTDDFPAPRKVEFDLDNRGFLRYSLPPGQLAYSMNVSVGFREKAVEVGQFECVRFVSRHPGQGKNPLAEQKILFTILDSHGAPEPVSHFNLVSTTSGRLAGLDCGFALDFQLPSPAQVVKLRLTTFAAPAEVTALNKAGKVVDRVTMKNPQRRPEWLQLSSKAITRVVVKAPNNETLLHEFCYAAKSPDQRDKPLVKITALLGELPVAVTTVSGKPGEVVEAVLEFDAISAIELNSGPAALIDLCYSPVSQDATVGWDFVPDFPYPLCLPVTHPDYPCSGNLPVDFGTARTKALNRVIYGPPTDWDGQPILDLHDQLVNLVTGGPGGPPMSSKTLPPIVGVPTPPDPGISSPHMPAQSPLDMVVLASLNPAVAQMLGLYWLDHSAPPGEPFDYLIVADYQGLGRRDPKQILLLIQNSDFSGLEGYIVFNKQATPAAPLDIPAAVRAYALPGATHPLQGGGQVDATNNVGLRWDLGVISAGALVPGHAIMYHVWRSDLGNADLPSAFGAPSLVTKERPVLVAEPLLAAGLISQRPPDWPPFPLHHIDQGLVEGWYGYQVSGIDIFGRHSPNSNQAAWFQWSPLPDPRPWYYQDPVGDRIVHPSAVRLLDKLPPPPPTGFEAYALDPADPTVVKDAAYNAWFATLSPAEQNTVIGLRVRWQWTDAHMRQAPDTKEFRIYYHPGLLNTLAGRVTAVSSLDINHSLVTTDIPNTLPADAYAGAWLRINGKNFFVTGSQAGTQLRLTVRNLGFAYATGTLLASNGSAILTGTGSNWHAGMVGLSLQVNGEADIYTVLSAQSATQLTLERLYAGATGTGKTYTIFSTRPKSGALCVLNIPAAYAEGSLLLTPGSPVVTGTGMAWNASLTGQTLRVEGDLGAYIVQSVDSPTQITLNRNYNGPGGANKVYGISHSLFTDYSLPANWDDRWYVVDYNQHVTVTTDAAGRPLRIYEVLLPAAGDVFRGGVPLVTSLAEPIVYAHVTVSAADNRPHTPDNPKWAAGRWANRSGNEGPAGSSAQIFRVHRTPPPPPAPPPDAERVFATPADYHSHSFYTYRWRPAANVKTHVFRALDDAIFKADWVRRPRPNLDAAQTQFFPDQAAEPRWDALKRGQVAAELNQLNGFAHPAGTVSVMAYYRMLSNDALRVLAGLEGNEHAFAQITINALDPADPANADRRGPDSPDAYAADPNLRAFVDTLDGRSTNRYFYRAQYVDAAQNRSTLSLSGPPVWLPNVVAPQAPVLTKVLGGDRQITLTWASNREPDLAEYRVYRVNSEDAARDLRLMTLVHTEAVPAGDPLARPAEVSWMDTPIPGLVTFYYRLVAVDNVGNLSDPSLSVAMRGYDESPPAVPTLTAGWSAPAPPANAEVGWTSTNYTRLERRAVGDLLWDAIGDWRPPGTYNLSLTMDASSSWRFRLRVQKETNALAVGPAVALPHL